MANAHWQKLNAMAKTNQSNVFAQPVASWQLVFAVKAPQVAALEAAWEDEALSVSSFEDVKNPEDWLVTLLLPYKPSNEEIKARTGALKVKAPKLLEVKEKDWVSEVQKSFKPLDIGRFLVHGSHHQGIDTTGRVVIQLDAGCAFGTGEHATTSLCLQAMEWAMKRYNISHALDVGTGSGILAIGFARGYHLPVIAADIDPVSVKVARENAALNRVSGLMRCEVAAGFRHAVIVRRGPYPLILANILAKPLVMLAPDFSKSMAAGGVAILSGLLSWQEQVVLSAYRQQGIRLVKAFRREGWSALVLRK